MAGGRGAEGRRICHGQWAESIWEEEKEVKLPSKEVKWVKGQEESGQS